MHENTGVEIFISRQDSSPLYYRIVGTGISAGMFKTPLTGVISPSADRLSVFGADDRIRTFSSRDFKVEVFSDPGFVNRVAESSSVSLLDSTVVSAAAAVAASRTPTNPAGKVSGLQVSGLKDKYLLGTDSSIDLQVLNYNAQDGPSGLYIRIGSSISQLVFTNGVARVSVNLSQIPANSLSTPKLSDYVVAVGTRDQVSSQSASALSSFYRVVSVQRPDIPFQPVFSSIGLNNVLSPAGGEFWSSPVGLSPSQTVVISGGSPGTTANIKLVMNIGIQNDWTDKITFDASGRATYDLGRFFQLSGGKFRDGTSVSISVTQFDGGVPRSSSTTALLNNTTPQSVSFQPSAPSFKEGENFHWVVSTSGIAPGTKMSYRIGGAGINSSDMTNLEGTFTVSGSDVRIGGAVLADRITEYTETARLEVFRGSSRWVSGAVDIVDSSTSPQPSPGQNAVFSGKTFHPTFQQDILTGTQSSDRFFISDLSKSLVAPSFNTTDIITGFQIGTDLIDGPSSVHASQVRHLGNIPSLFTGELSWIPATSRGQSQFSWGHTLSAQLSPAVFASNGAATFTVANSRTGSSRTFLALNNSVAGFDQFSDAILEITGYSGSLTSLSIV
jgi:hypothetical protein